MLLLDVKIGCGESPNFTTSNSEEENKILLSSSLL